MSDGRTSWLCLGAHGRLRWPPLPAELGTEHLLTMLWNDAGFAGWFLRKLQRLDQYDQMLCRQHATGGLRLPPQPDTNRRRQGDTTPAATNAEPAGRHTGRLTIFTSAKMLTSLSLQAQLPSKPFNTSGDAQFHHLFIHIFLVVRTNSRQDASSY